MRRQSAYRINIKYIPCVIIIATPEKNKSFIMTQDKPVEHFLVSLLSKCPSNLHSVPICVQLHWFYAAFFEA